MRGVVVAFAAAALVFPTTELALADDAEVPPQARGALEALLRAPGPAGPVQAGLLGTGFRPVEKETRERPRPRYVFPIRGPVGYGEAMARFGSNRGGRMHEGQDVFAPAGTPLVSVTDGLVVETGSGDGRGHYVAIYDPREARTYVYFHMQSPSRVSVGRRVSAGDGVGRVGCTGSCWGDHLHFEVRRGRSSSGAVMDPMPLLRRWSR